MESGVLVVPSVSFSVGLMPPDRPGPMNRDLALAGNDEKPKTTLVKMNSQGVGAGGSGGGKQKHKSEGQLILVMEPQNPSPTKYFDQNGIPLKKEFIESAAVYSDGGLEREEVPDKPIAGTNKKRTKLTITCHKCAKTFETKIEFEFHYRKTYNQEPVYACTTCDKRISQYKAYRLHIYRHSNSANQRYICGTCSKVFHQKSDLNRHELVHENQTQSKQPSAQSSVQQQSTEQSAQKGSPVASTSEQPAPVPKVIPLVKVTCDRCDAVFDSQAEARLHIRKLHPIPKQMIECPDCGKFLSAGSLYSHRKIHSDGPKYTCEECQKSFVQKINFIHHRKKHLPNDERPFPCGECGKAFFEKSHLQRHQFFHSEERPYKCELCGKCYKTERCLKVHSAVHNADRPFVCTECNKGFLSSSKLRQHSNIHSGLRPFKCKYCARDFTNFPNWLKHIRRRHKVDHRTGEKLDSVPKFMTKAKTGAGGSAAVNAGSASTRKKAASQPKAEKVKGTEKAEKIKNPSSKKASALTIKEILPLTIIKEEESLPFVGDNSNIDLNLVSKDDLLQPLKMELEMDNMFLSLPGQDEDACDVPLPLSNRIRELEEEDSSVASKSDAKQSGSKTLRGMSLGIDGNDPPFGLAIDDDDNELFRFGYDVAQPEFDCDFSIKNNYPEAVNVIRESESATMNILGASSPLHSNHHQALSSISTSNPTVDIRTDEESVNDLLTGPAGGTLVYDLNNELPIFPTLISICGDENQQQFQLINPHFLHLPLIRRTVTASAVPSSTPDLIGLKLETP
ncbi:zinc finger protein 880 [Uranotaenia lowii]|uniref:zinc finger protein 880 n=1 Tax=Uranotaenia lowii TaxID=190385 RepID=UPI00247B2C12|nr:zinc finger protein 880 [Uranotaenia lowii]